MNKKWLWGIISGFYAISTIVLISIIVVQNENKVVNNVNNLSQKNNTLTMMLETDVGSNEYEVATSNEWPEEGYIFNAEMSACERGSELIWNEETKTVNLKTNMSDTCYIYFDKVPNIYVTDIELYMSCPYTEINTISINTGTIADVYIKLLNTSEYFKFENNQINYGGWNYGCTREISYDLYVVTTDGYASEVYSGIVVNECHEPC